MGFAVQVGAGVDAAILVLGASANTFSALTRTGITPPVTKLKGWWLMALRIAAMDPEWLVKEM